MPTYVSLFSGCGGLDLGFAIAGYRCLGAYDVDTAAVDTYNHNFPSEQALVADLSGDYLNNLHRHADAVVKRGVSVLRNDVVGPMASDGVLAGFNDAWRRQPARRKAARPLWEVLGGV